MNKLWLGLATAVVASTACAAWTLDGSTLSNETWHFSVTKKNTIELTLTGGGTNDWDKAEAPNYDVDFKNEVISDGSRSDYKVVGINKGRLFQDSKCTRFLAPDCVTFNNGEFMFYRAYGLVEVEVSPDFDKCGQGAFYECSNLEKITPTVFPKLTSLPNQVQGFGVFGACPKLVGDFEFPECTFMGAGSFSGDKLVTSVKAPKATEVRSSSFYGCLALVSVELSPNLAYVAATLCRDCTSLVTFEPQVSDTVAAISAADDPTKGGNYAFYNCTSLTGNFSYPNCKVVGNGSFYNTKITGFSAAGCTNVVLNAFSGCSELKTAEFGSGLKRLGNSAFNGCKLMTSFSPLLPKDMDEVGTSVFYGCSKLASDLVWDQKTIAKVPDSIFRGCPSLASITFKNVGGFGTFSFYSCSTNTVVNFESAPPANFTTAQAPFSAANNGKNDPYVFRVTNAAVLDSWKMACEPNATTFESWKTHKDYPGKKTIGLITNAGGPGASASTHWVLDATAAPGSLIMLM